MTTLRRPDRPTERDLAALADGSLTGRRRARVERAVAASRELRAELDAQRSSRAAMRALEAENAPAALRARVALASPPRRSAHRLRTLAVAAAAAVAVAVAVLALGGNSGGPPSVADAAQLGDRPAVAPVPAAAPGTRLPFPDWRARFGWTAAHGREDRLGGRIATTVFYRRETQVVAYTIVGGRPLRGGRVLRSFDAGDRHAVTWLRDGHTCVLSSTTAAPGALVRLAATQ